MDTNISHIKLFSVLFALQKRDSRINVFFFVQHFFPNSASFLFENTKTVSQHQIRERFRGMRRIYASMKTLSHKLGNTANVVKVPMAYQQHVNGRRIKWKILGVSLLAKPRALKETAINEHAGFFCFQQITRAGYLLRTPIKCEF